MSVTAARVTTAEVTTGPDCADISVEIIVVAYYTVIVHGWLGVYTYSVLLPKPLNKKRLSFSKGDREKTRGKKVIYDKNILKILWI